MKMIDGEFPNMQKVPRNHWKKLGNQKEFFLNLAKELKIKEPKKWGTVSKSHVLDRGGGGLLQIYGGSLRTGFFGEFIFLI